MIEEKASRVKCNPHKCLSNILRVLELLVDEMSPFTVLPPQKSQMMSLVSIAFDVLVPDPLIIACHPHPSQKQFALTFIANPLTPG